MLTIKVTTINNVYHSRLISDGKVIDEMSCENKSDIGWICREMLRWYSKMGGTDPWATSARNKQTGPRPIGVKYIMRSE